MRRLFIAEHWQVIKVLVPDFNLKEDLYISTNDAAASRRLGSLLPMAESTYLVGDWLRGRYWQEVSDQLNMRLMRSGDEVKDCQRIPG